MLLFFAMVAFGLILVIASALASVLAAGIEKLVVWAVTRRAAAKRARGLS